MAEPEITTLRLDRPGIRAALGDLEAAIMEIVWARPMGQGLTVREVWEELHSRRGIMYTSVMNTMTRLARKGLLTAEQKERAYVYRAALSQDAFVERFVGDALERLLANFGGTTRERLQQIADPVLQDRLAELLERIAERRAAEETT